MGKEDKNKSAERTSKPFVARNKKPSGSDGAAASSGSAVETGGKSKFPRRIKRNDLVVQKEKLKMMHKYKKMMRQERQELGRDKNGKQTTKNIQFPRLNFGNNEDKTYLSANKKSQAEYEKKKRQREVELEV
jgi:hypothetical protein